MKIEITLDLSHLRWPAGIAIVALCASCVPSSANQLAHPAATLAIAPAPVQLDAATREQVSRKVAQLLVPVSTSPAAAFIDASQSEEDHERSLNCLTAAVYYEARSESEDGQRAVAQVVLNRVRHPAFPSTVCGVVFQGHERATGCQFSFTCDGSMRGRREPLAWIRARRIAAEALAGSVYAPIGNATHYHTTAIMPYWARYLQKSAIVGAHIFYRWAGSAGQASAFRQNYGGLEPEPSLWQASDIAGVTVHNGSDVHQAIEAITLDDGAKVTVHRGADAQGEATQETMSPPREAAQQTTSFGVRVHSGMPPEIG